jgi:hypothetical protein
LETAIPYFIRLLEEEKYDDFIDKAIAPSSLSFALARQSRDELRLRVKEVRKDVIEFLRECQELKGEPFEDPGKKGGKGMRFRTTGGHGIVLFYQRNGVWYVKF